MHCPYCANTESKVLNTQHDPRGGIRRRRVCAACGQRYTTYERAVLATPLLVKQNGDREEFEREKLINGIRMACAKRPVPAVAITDLADQIELALQQMGADEVPSRVVGDMVLGGLRDLDDVAYIRYALIYMALDNLDTIRSEVDRLIAAKKR